MSRLDVNEQVLREALRLACEAFAQYAFNTNDVSEDAIEYFAGGCIQQADLNVKLRHERAGGDE